MFGSHQLSTSSKELVGKLGLEPRTFTFRVCCATSCAICHHCWWVVVESNNSRTARFYRPLARTTSFYHPLVFLFGWGSRVRTYTSSHSKCAALPVWPFPIMCCLVPPDGIEPPTRTVSGCRSTCLSYRSIKLVPSVGIEPTTFTF